MTNAIAVQSVAGAATPLGTNFPKRLLIVSHTPHFGNGRQLVGWGPTVREIDYLSSLFEEVVHVAPWYEEPAPASSLAYESPRVRVESVRPAGGDGWKNKIDILRCYPGYVRTLHREIAKADMVHVRCPANISLLAIVLLTFLRKPDLRWVKYAGDWHRQTKEPWAYAFQRWWLRGNRHRGVVTVNGQDSGNRSHIHSFFNPSLTDAELVAGNKATSLKHLQDPLRLIFVGRLESEKGVGLCLEIARSLLDSNVNVRLDLVGDGPERGKFEARSHQLSLTSKVTFHGWLPRQQIESIYQDAHFNLLPTSCSEGWPKVLSEGMAYGVVPLATRVASIPEFLERFETGRAISECAAPPFVQAILEYRNEPNGWRRESQNAARAASQFSYAHYLDAVRKLLSPSSQLT
jgi:glycosyltransferase involved in cell wall biosynthesis